MQVIAQSERSILRKIETKDDAIMYGRGAGWCTSPKNGKGTNYYDIQYGAAHGELYIISEGRRPQVQMFKSHIGTREFKRRGNKNITLDQICQKYPEFQETLKLIFGKTTKEIRDRLPDGQTIAMWSQVAHDGFNNPFLYSRSNRPQHRYRPDGWPDEICTEVIWKPEGSHFCGGTRGRPLTQAPGEFTYAVTGERVCISKAPPCRNTFYHGMLRIRVDYSVIHDNTTWEAAVFANGVLIRYGAVVNSVEAATRDIAEEICLRAISDCCMRCIDAARVLPADVGFNESYLQYQLRTAMLHL